jgi:hypothetical protein
MDRRRAGRWLEGRQAAQNGVNRLGRPGETATLERGPPLSNIRATGEPVVIQTTRANIGIRGEWIARWGVSSRLPVNLGIRLEQDLTWGLIPRLRSPFFENCPPGGGPPFLISARFPQSHHQKYADTIRSPRTDRTIAQTILPLKCAPGTTASTPSQSAPHAGDQCRSNRR